MDYGVKRLKTRSLQLDKFPTIIVLKRSEFLVAVQESWCSRTTRWTVHLWKHTASFFLFLFQTRRYLTSYVWP